MLGRLGLGLGARAARWTELGLRNGLVFIKYLYFEC